MVVSVFRPVRTYVRDIAGITATRFKRAIERRSLINAELAARETARLSLEQALKLVVLYTSLLRV